MLPKEQKCNKDFPKNHIKLAMYSIWINHKSYFANKYMNWNGLLRKMGGMIPLIWRHCFKYIIHKSCPFQLWWKGHFFNSYYLYMIKSGSGNLKGTFWRATHDVNLDLTLILREWTQRPQYGFAKWEQILFEVAFNINIIFEDF